MGLEMCRKQNWICQKMRNMRKLQREEDKLLKPPEREGLDSLKPGS
jgi:hypothetical protein